MATGTIVTFIGTGVTILGFLLDRIPTANNDHAKISYAIANDGANGDLTGAGGHLPDVRLWDETGEFLGITTQDGVNCGEGFTTCTTDVSTNEAPTYTLFTGNDDAICIAWTGISFPGGNQKFGFHPGQWAYGCSAVHGSGGGRWYYAGTSVPGIDENEETVYCAWVDSNGDVETTGFQVHWPEFDGDQRALSYYCDNTPPVNFRTEPDPSTAFTWAQKRIRNLFSHVPALPRAEFEREARSGGNGQQKTRRNLESTFATDPRIFKSRRAHHKASELCDPIRGAAGQSFVSYAERLFCYMPTKTLYPFCENVADGACWADDENRITTKGDSMQLHISVPDMSHINKTVIWE